MLFFEMFSEHPRSFLLAVVIFFFLAVVIESKKNLTYLFIVHLGTMFKHAAVKMCALQEPTKTGNMFSAVCQV